MARGTRRWLPIVVGIVILVAMVGIAAVVVSVAWFQQNVQVNRGTTRESAASQFDDAKRRFPDQRPVLEFDDERRPRFVQGIESRKNPGTVSDVHVLAWDPDEQAMATVTIPLWFLRLKSGPIVLGEYVSGFDDDGLRLEPEDLERYGPGIVFEYQRGSGERVLVSAH